MITTFTEICDSIRLFFARIILQILAAGYLKKIIIDHEVFMDAYNALLTAREMDSVVSNWNFTRIEGRTVTINFPFLDHDVVFMLDDDYERNGEIHMFIGSDLIAETVFCSIYEFALNNALDSIPRILGVRRLDDDQVDFTLDELRVLGPSLLSRTVGLNDYEK